LPNPCQPPARRFVTHALDTALIDGEKTEWSNLQSLLGAFWSAMLEHGMTDNQLKNWGAEGHGWISHLGNRLKPEHFIAESRDGDYRDDWN
jgi:hypothetical protein